MSTTRITLISLSMIAVFSNCSPPKAQVVSSITNSASLPDSLVKRVNQLDAFFDASGLTGGILVQKGNTTLLSKGSGWANAEKGLVNSENTVFNIGSIAKQFTAASILKLEEVGKLSTSDTIGKFFPSVPADKKNITIHHLLTHTSGLKRDVIEKTIYPSRDEYIKMVMSANLQSKPEEKYSYSNAGYSLLGAIIEIVSGMSYENYLRQTLWLPAGMKQTGFVLPAWNKKNWSYAFQSNISYRSPDSFWGSDGPSWAVRGSGEILSTLLDLQKWGNVLKGDQVLSSAIKSKMFKPYVAMNKEGKNYYGYGWIVEKTSWNTTMISNTGENGYYQATLYNYTDDDVIIINYINDLTKYSDRFINALSTMFFTGFPSFPEPKIKLSSAQLRQLGGVYKFDSGEEFHIEVQNEYPTINIIRFPVARYLTQFGVINDSLRLKDLSTRISYLFDNMFADKFNTIEKDLDFEGSLAEERKYWLNKFEDWKEYGSYKKVDVIGTVQRKNFLTTYVLLQFEKDNLVVQVRQNNERKFYVGVSDDGILPRYYRLMPQSATSFAIYNPVAKRTVTVEWEEKAKRLRIKNGNETYSATKLK
ncbi:MAG TPA: serine hydrolase domain-containing protein [Chondromyces sp.]|nr:serine hydrolase domain-containing protein [Chondromyces sp.]